MRNENTDSLAPWVSELVPPFSAFFYECSFLTLPLMAWIIYSTIQNKHTRQGPRSKPRKSGKRKRANSFDSRRTLPQVDFVVQANEDLQPSNILLAKKRTESFDARETNVRKTELPEVEINSDDDSLNDLSENIGRFERQSSMSSHSEKVVPAHLYQPPGEDDSSSDGSRKNENPFLMPKRRRSSQDGESDYRAGSVEDESDDESIFDKLRDAVESAMFKGDGPHAILHRARDSRVEVGSTN